MNAKRRWILGAVSGLAAACGLLVWLSQQRRPGQVQRLPDGSTLEFRGITTGTHHHWDDGTPWQQATRWWSGLAATAGIKLPVRAAGQSFLPGAQGNSDPGVQDLDTPSDETVLWFRLQNRASHRPVTNWLTAVTVDSHGCRLHCPPIDALATTWFHGWGSQSGALYPVPLTVYPRRDRSFQLQLREWDGRQVAEYRVTSPSQPSWQEADAPPCPVQAESGNLQVTLRRLTHDTSGPLARSRPEFEYLEEGKPTRNWTVARVDLRDATGNAILTSDTFGMPLSRDGFDALCRYEPAWKLRVRLMRPHPEQAPAVKTWQVHVSAFPPRNAALPIKSRVNGSRVSVQAGYLTGGGIARYGNTTLSAAVPMAHFVLGTKDTTSQLSLLRISGPGDRAYSVPPGSSRLLTGERDYDFELPNISPGTPVDLTFALHETRVVEFLVKP